jgi:hypothetical protein
MIKNQLLNMLNPNNAEITLDDSEPWRLNINSDLIEEIAISTLSCDCSGYGSL